MPKKLDEVKITKPLQLSLFEILTETDILTDEGNRELQVRKGRNYSQTFELIDFMPRFVWGHQKDLRKDYNGLLPALQRDFISRGTKFRLTLKAATLVDKKGRSIAYYPGASEDLLEVVLRKMYLDNPQYMDGLPGMTFTINQIREEMKNQGHTRSHSEILQSLEILTESSINCQNLESDAKLFFRVINTLALSTEKSPHSPCYLTFSKPYAEALEGLYFRRFNYKQVVRYKNNFARLLHRRISHHFTQASDDKPYEVYLTTLIRDFGLQYQNLTKAKYDLLLAKDEMVKAGVIKDLKIDPIIDMSNKRKIEDYFLKIQTTNNFSFEAKNSNLVTKKVAEISSMRKEDLNAEVEKKEIAKKTGSKDEISDSFDVVLPASLNRKSRKDNKKRLKG